MVISMRVLVLLIFFSCFVIGGELTPREYKIKAGYIYNFIRYTSTNDNQTIEVCSHSHDFLEAANLLLDHRKLNNRSVDARHVHRTIEGCDVLFVTEQDVNWWKEVFANKQLPAGLLVIGESKDFAKELGHINFVVVGNKVRFEVNPDALKASDINISSKVLRLGKIVAGGRR